ncbi:hypothetical protein ACUOFC_58915, partial [Escherichia sp. TWPC-MK]
DEYPLIRAKASLCSSWFGLTVSGWRQFVSGFNEALTMAWRALAANKMRTLLTMLGIIIGIASVVSIVVVGDAAKIFPGIDINSIRTKRT